MSVKNIKIDVDVYTSLERDGILTQIFIGETDTPIEHTRSWTDLINQEFDPVVVQGFEQDVFPKYDETDDYSYPAVQSLRELSLALRVAADMLDDRVNNAMVFDREAWIQDGKNYDSKDQYLSPVTPETL